jgi:hypothetical protein
MEITFKSKRLQKICNSEKELIKTLISTSILNNWLKNTSKLNTKLICDFAQEINVAPGILVGRLQYLKYIKYSEFNTVKFKYDWPNYLLPKACA